MFTFNGDGIKTCKRCERKMTTKDGVYESVCCTMFNQAIRI